MQIIDKQIKDLKPYENNPRKNDEAVKYVAESIKQFGFKVPIIIDKDNIIITGHTRYKAAKQLKIEVVPCIIADDLTEEQIKAFRLADNKVAEFAEWDLDLLNAELENIFDIDMSEIGFDLFEEENEEIPEDLERETETNEKFIVKVTFDTYQDWLDKEDEFRRLVENSNANMVVGSV